MLFPTILQRVEIEVPVPPPLHAARLHRQGVAGLEQADSLEQGGLAEGVLKGEIVHEGRQADFARNSAQAQQRLDLGRKNQRTVGLGIIQRLDPVPVPGQQQGFCPVVPECEREHAVQPLDTVGSELLVEMKQDLRVRTRDELVPFPLQLFFQLEVVVDFPVIGDPDRPGPIGHRLIDKSRMASRRCPRARR